MKSLFIYYSYTGSGEVVAEYFAKHDVALRKVEIAKKLPKSFFWGMMTGGFLAGRKYKDKLVDFDNVLEGYDRIYLGSPIWNGRFSTALNGMLSQLDLSNKNVTFVFYAGSGEGKHALKRVQKEYPNASVIFLKEPKKYPEELNKLNGLFS